MIHKSNNAARQARKRRKGKETNNLNQAYPMRSRRGTGFPSACPQPVAVSQCSNITPLIVDVTLPLLLSTIVSVSLHRGWQSDKLTQYHKKPTRLECEGLVQNVQAFDSLTFFHF
ncbi:uncharacterized protein LACBIDRAFT_296405 [Laccaria bicolor S238N-H82]|uniref:Predicted protein n=1 Tax=Laccaria bicolor (strain S238N-H82 / ATCC MYA-4686) TaxID=486041 RepID=B0D8Q5_LACBS|nr:uncharacterized protein LACBIDRAFT_296405 [Laccaria bicolor S238N-H82]EDR08884.1 predicted protein [Laccaria bicolor S238N-H82]|eukprot:XP_001880197.1 predicted protein [Laccaria bicolor S238N-H82]